MQVAHLGSGSGSVSGSSQGQGQGQGQSQSVKLRVGVRVMQVAHRLTAPLLVSTCKLGTIGGRGRPAMLGSAALGSAWLVLTLDVDCPSSSPSSSSQVSLISKGLSSACTGTPAQLCHACCLCCLMLCCVLESPLIDMRWHTRRLGTTRLDR